MLKEAILYGKLDAGKVSCFLCSHHCLIEDGKFGLCQVRQNKDGVLYTHAYGGVVAANIDPIEKKPIFHMLPGSKSFSVATFGCNFRCGFCQNWQISQKKEADNLGADLQAISPDEIVKAAQSYNCKSISYTYTEPTIFLEYALDIAKKAKDNGLYNIFVTNGYMTKEAIGLLQPVLDAANVDLKFFNDDNYRKVCGGSLAPVLDSIRLMRKYKIWVEVTTLVVPGLNDSNNELRGIADFLAKVGPEVPWHISRFHPDYQMARVEATPISKLRHAYAIGKEAGLRYVYIGNVPEEEKTSCYACGKGLISRLGFEVTENKVKDAKCPYCDAAIDGLFLSASVSK